MKDFDGICMNCFEELTQGSVCAHCGYDNDKAVDMMYLSPKTVIEGRYVVGAVIAHESDAAVYAGYDLQLNTKINIREFLPKGIANRLEGNLDVHIRERYRASYESLKESFVKLWSTIVKMHNLSAVVPAYDVFELNKTAYAICENMESISLRDFLIKTPEGNIPWERARLMFMPVLTTIEALHSNGIIHGAISPDTLVLCRDGKIRLKGFSISEANVQSGELQFNENEGYTALEQYENNHKLCPATDIYAFSACIFRALVGQNPPNAKERELNDRLMIPNSIAEKIPTYIIKALGGGLQVYPEKRTQTIEQFRELLNASPSVVAASAPVITDENDPVKEEEYYRGYPEYENPKKNKNTSKIIIAVLVILIIAAVIAGAYVVKSGSLNKDEDTTTQLQQVESYTVPDFISAGYTQSDVQNHGAWNQQFKITYNSEFSVEAEEGIIFKQSIKAGETVEQGTEIVLTVSKGVETAKVPDVGGKTLEEATQILKKAGFTVSSVEVYNDGEFLPNTVKGIYGMAPKAGSIVAVGEEIILQVYGEIQTTTAPATTENADGED